MRHFPVFLNVDGRRVAVSGAGETAVAKLRLLMKTDAHINVFGSNPDAEIIRWASEGKIHLREKPVEVGDTLCTAMLYCANDDADEDARVAAIGRADGALVNIVDNLEDSQFITPAIVDRDPVTIAIGTEGAAPVLARQIKADLENRLPQSLGLLARIGQSFRSAVAKLPAGRPRRNFWSQYYTKTGPEAFAKGGEDQVRDDLQALLDNALAAANDRGDRHSGHVAFVGAGPGDPDLMTVKAQKALHEADVVIHDRLVSAEILELARREAIMINVGKKGFGKSTPQSEINALLVQHAREGNHVVRLKSGDPSVFGRLDEELDALDAAKIPYDVIPGITAASAASATMTTSMTRRERNNALNFVTGHAMNGFAEQDWRELAKPGAVAAIYMGVRASTFLRGRLLMHGASPNTPITVVENVSRLNQKIVSTTLIDLPHSLAEADMKGPAVLMLGLSPRKRTAGAASRSITPQPLETARVGTAS